jgi:putative flippase GtrA
MKEPDRTAGGRLATPPLRHYGGFVLGGVLALTTDALILEILTRFTGLHALLARPVGIVVAMVVSWRVNRRVTFAVTAAPSLGEFGRFAGVSWTAQAVNYGVFSALLLLRPGTPPLLALFLASLVAMFVSYFGFKHGVFGSGRDPLRGARP